MLHPVSHEYVYKVILTPFVPPRGYGKGQPLYGIVLSYNPRTRFRTYSTARRKLPPQGVHNGQRV